MKTALTGVLAMGVLLAGCAQAAPSAPTPAGSATRTTVPSATAPNPPSPEPATTGETRTDDQGSVVFQVTPLNLGSPGETLDFDVSMNTHSVDVGWDLAAQSVLITDSGVEVQGVSWPVGGGHHYGGTLSFPARTAEGTPVLEGASTLTLVIRDTDVAKRVFTWELTPR
ncbi:MAG TPA: hypothetical protein VLD63_09515 [Anaerolineales bacterium]|nr:hypothetical protein [Anaerolineales bacterium]